jgi:hypothetical protein
MLESFLREYQDRRRLRAQRPPSSASSAYGDSSRAAGGGHGPFDASQHGRQGPAAKRQRLAEATKQEDQRSGMPSSDPPTVHATFPSSPTLISVV